MVPAPLRNASFLIDLCEDMVFSPKPILTIRGQWGAGTPVQVTGMIKWGQKSKPKKSLEQNLIPQKSHSNFPSHKNFQWNYAAMIRRNYRKSSDYFEYPKKSLLKSSYSKKYVPKFSYPNKSRNQKFQTLQNPSIIPLT